MGSETERETASTLRRFQSATRGVLTVESRAALFERAADAAAELFDADGAALYERDPPSEPRLLGSAAAASAEKASSGDRSDAFLGGDGVPEIDGRSIFEAEEVVVRRTDGEVTIVVPFDERVLYLRGDSAFAADEAGDEEVALARLFGQRVSAVFDRIDRAAALEARQTALEERDRRLDRFAGLIAHEFRNPIGIASGHLDLVIGTEGDDRHLDAVRGAVDRMDRLTESLLDLVRGEPLSGNVATVSLGYLARDVFEPVCPAAATLDVEDSVIVRANDRRLRTALENLFEEALDRGGSSVEIRIGALAEGGFFVADDGPSLDRTVDADPFAYRPAGETDRTDLRLAIVHDVAAAHGWTVTVVDRADGEERIEFRTADEDDG